jgi:hypothetical protein
VSGISLRGARRGSLLIAVLLTSVVLLMMGMAVLGVQSRQYKGVRLLRQAQVAKGLAQAGLEDAELKLEKDLDFPPSVERQKIYEYEEEVFDVDGSERIGSYIVTVNMENRESRGILTISSLGLAGPREKTLAERRITADLYCNPAATSSPDYFKLIRWQDHGNF